MYETSFISSGLFCLDGILLVHDCCDVEAFAVRVYCCIYKVAKSTCIVINYYEVSMNNISSLAFAAVMLLYIDGTGVSSGSGLNPMSSGNVFPVQCDLLGL
ncbi:hypothetical protein VNO77_18671 [Canavalia gladiata]|uniref:Uncharacterized protein n=1 Tax=Canavalia gladiata TaxID=3824 RepID=A0AAN9QNX0_CANGL